MNTQRNKWNGTLQLAVALAFGIATAVQAAEPEKKGWETTAAAGFTLTSGNSETMLFTAGLESKRKWDKTEAAYGLSAGYGKSEGNNSTDFMQAFGLHNWLLSERFYLGLRLDGNHDGIADLSYRFRLTPLAGYYLIKNDRMSLSVEAGPSLVNEKYEGLTPDTYCAIRFGERFDYKISDTTKFWQSLEYVPQVDRWQEKYLVNFEAGISTAINKQWDLRLVAQLAHDSEPLPGRDYNDVRLVAGTGYKF
jgi:putative salt-induced outer membrane protein YdiY